MPYQVLSNGRVDLCAWSVVACVTRGAVTHVALVARDKRNVSRGDRVPVYHMGPPVTVDVSSQLGSEEDGPTENEDEIRPPDSNDSSEVHIVAWLGDLSRDEARAMGRWYKRISAFFNKTPPSRPDFRPRNVMAIARYLRDCRYIAHPPYETEIDPVSGNLKSISFSCTGFVMCCYESVAVTKLIEKWDTPDFPKIGIEQICEVWPWFKPQMMDDLKPALNLLGSGPWPIVVPGYIIKAFQREDYQVRNNAYSPSLSDLGLS